MVYVKRMQQMRRDGTDMRGVPCTALIPLCVPHFHPIPESVLSCQVPQSKDFHKKTRYVSSNRGGL